MTYQQAKSYIRKNFTDGVYSGDNPYLVGTSVVIVAGDQQEQAEC